MPSKLDCNSIQKKKLLLIPLKSCIIPFENSSNIKIFFKVNDLLFHSDDPKQYNVEDLEKAEVDDHMTIISTQ